MNDFLDYFFLRNPNVRWVVLAVLLMCASSGLVGTFAFLRKRALAGDAISHAILPGICVAFMLVQSKNPLILLIGAIASGLVGLWSIEVISKRTKLKPDAALSLVLSVFYGIGIFLLTIIQGSGSAAQSGLDKFLFGKAAAMVPTDVMVFSGFSLLLIGCVVALYKPLKVFVFDPHYGETRGFPNQKLELLLSLLMVFAIAIGIQAVGVVLMAALLITPAAAARYWTDNLKWMMVLAVFIAVLSGWSGTLVSYLVPKMPTGPWIVTVLSVLTMFSVTFGKKKGVLFHWQLQRRNVRKMIEENILKALYHITEKDQDFKKKRSLNEIQEHRYFDEDQLRTGLKRLSKKHLTNFTGNSVWLTDEGLEEGQRVTKIHRLWELYLTKVMQLPSDHVHEDAEAIEHIITPELEAELERQLEYPLIDPHDSPIPYQKSAPEGR